MNKGRVIRLLSGMAVFFALLFIYIGLSSPWDENHEDGNDQSVFIVEEPVMELRWQRSDGVGAVLRKMEEGWVWADQISFPVNQTMAQMMADTAAAPEITRVLELNRENQDRYGLTSPVCTVVIKTEKEEYVLSFGSQNSATGDYYMMSDSRDQIYMTPERVFNLYNHDILDLAVTEIIPGIPLNCVEKFSVVQGSENFALKWEEDTGQWITEDSGTVEQAADAWLAESLISSFLGLKFTEMVCFEPKDEELNQWGLTGEKRLLTLTYDSREGTQEYQLLLGNRDESGAGRYCMPADGRAVYLTDAERADQLLSLKASDYADLDVIDREPAAVGKLIVRIGEEQAALNAGETNFNEIFFALYGLKGEKRIGEESDRQGEALLEFEIDMNEGENLNVTFYLYDQHYCLADSGGRLLLVNRQSVRKLLETAQEIIPQL